MAIDDPIDAALEQVSSDERQESPVLQPFLDGLELIPGISFLPKVFKKLASYKEDNVRYLLHTILKQLKTLQTKLHSLGSEHLDFLEENFQALLVDAIAKSENLRGKDRIRRIAFILAYACDEDSGARDADYIAEMVRVAADLGDDDVRVLREIDRVQAANLSKDIGTVNNESVNEAWRDDPPKISGLSDGKIQSICAKLQSFGLVTRVDRNPSKLFHTTIPYGLLQKGHDFIVFVKGEAE